MTRSRALRTLLPATVVLVVFALVLPRIASYGAAVRLLRNVGPRADAALATVALLNVLSTALPWMAALPGLGVRRAVAVTQASTLATLAPLGEAMGIAVSLEALRRFGYRAGDIARAVVLTGVVGQVATALAPVAGFAALSLEGRPAPVVSAAAIALSVVGLVVLAAVIAVLARDAWAQRVGDVVGRVLSRIAPRLLADAAALPERLVAIRREALGLSGRGVARLAAATVVSQAATFAVLVAALNAVGQLGRVSVAGAFAAWTFARLATAVPITPAGAGPFELVLSESLIRLGATPPGALAGTLAYRFLTIVPTLLVGVPSLVLLARRAGSSAARAG